MTTPAAAMPRCSRLAASSGLYWSAQLTAVSSVQACGGGSAAGRLITTAKTTALEASHSHHRIEELGMAGKPPTDNGFDAEL